MLLGVVLAIVAGSLWRDVIPREKVVRVSPLTGAARSLPGGLTLHVPDGVVLESAGYPLAGRFVSTDARTNVRVQAAWSELPGSLSPKDLASVQAAWLGAVSASGLAPAMSAAPEGEVCAGHVAVRATGLAAADRQQYRAVSWACPQSRRIVHVLVAAPVGVDVARTDADLCGKSSCHATGVAAPVGPQARLPESAKAAGWREMRGSGSRRTYLGPSGVIEAVLEEGPAPAQSPVDHVLRSSELWAPLLTGVLGRSLPVEAPGASRVEKLAHGHEAVRVHGRVQPPPTAQAPMSPVLFVETTVWVCPKSERMVSLSVVTPDRKALERARAVLDSVACH